jgi:hypothetical protein
MKKIILRFGAYAALLELVIFLLIALIIWLSEPSHKVQGYLGWVNLLLPLLFVYFGIRYFRDHFNKGELTFLTALKIGLLITLIPAFAFALIETVFVIYIEPDFYERTFQYDLEEHRKVLSPEAFSHKEKEVKEQLVLSNNPFFNFAMMMLMITALGAIVTSVSSLLLYRKTR